MTAHLTARLSDGTVVEDQQLKFVTDEGAPSSAGCPNSVQNPRIMRWNAGCGGSRTSKSYPACFMSDRAQPAPRAGRRL